MKLSLLTNAFTCGSGLLLGVIFLYWLEHFSPEILPMIFVDRRFPVDLTLGGMFIAFSIPFGISCLFSFLSLSQLGKGEETFLSLIRRLA